MSKKNRTKVISISWSIHDVIAQAHADEIKIVEESEELASHILERLEKRHDSSIGINWDVVSATIYEVARECLEALSPQQLPLYINHPWGALQDDYNKKLENAKKEKH